jgi:hypothetical protein
MQEPVDDEIVQELQSHMEQELRQTTSQAEAQQLRRQLKLLQAPQYIVHVALQWFWRWDEICNKSQVKADGHAAMPAGSSKQLFLQKVYCGKQSHKAQYAHFGQDGCSDVSKLSVAQGLVRVHHVDDLDDLAPGPLHKRERRLADDEFW